MMHLYPAAGAGGGASFAAVTAVVLDEADLATVSL